MKLGSLNSIHFSLNKAGSDHNTVFGKLTSGKKITRAADDAAGLSIVQKVARENRGLDVGADNIRDGIGVADVMDGALSSITDSLQRIRELGVRASNGLSSNSDKAMIQSEVGQLLEEIQRTAVDTKFNERTLLDGSMADMKIASNANGTGLKIGMESMTLQSLGIDGFDVTKDFDLSSVDAALEKVSFARSKEGAFANSLEYAYNSNKTTSLNLTASRSRIEDLDLPQAVTEKQKNKLLQDYRLGMMRKKMQEDTSSVQRLFGM